MVNFSKLISTGIPALILLYVFYHIAFNVPVIYTIDIGSEGDTDAGKDAYLRNMTSQARLTGSMSIEGDTFRNMTGSPLYFYITPANGISNHTNITVELKFKGDTDLDIGVYPGYAWKPLYIKNLENYTPVRQFGEVVIYAKNDSGNYTDYDTINEWISENIPRGSTIGLYDYEMDPSILINKNLAYQNAFTEINQTLRGTHSFLVYLNDTFNLSLSKQDLNWYNGSDEYSVELYDADGNLFFNDTIPDDGIDDDSRNKMPPQFQTFFIDGIREGLYELRFINIKTDSTIIRIKINTVKMITQRSILPLNPGKLFFDLKQNTTLKFYAWHGNAVQNITILGETDKDILIENSILGKEVPVELPKGSYSMSIKGDLHISGANFAFTEESLFQPYNYEINNENNQWIIISNYSIEKDSYGWTTAKKIFKGFESELNKDKTIIFGLKNKTDAEVMLNEFKVTLIPR